MTIKKILKKTVFNISSALTDMLYLRPYRDPEGRIRMHTEDRILHMDLVITERCSRKCRDCSNLMQYYRSPEHLSSEDVINDLKKILDCVSIHELKILGGEPFVNSSVLKDVLGYLSKEAGKRVDIINIITNGTVIPDEDCLKAIKDDPKIMITFSNYKTESSAQPEFIELCKKSGIRYMVIDDSYYWLDFGRPAEYEESGDFVKRQYRNCHNRKNCNTLFRGRFYVCPRQAHGIHLGLIPDTKDGYIDIHDPRYDDSKDLRRAISELVRRKNPVEACRYCVVGKYIHIPRAVQEKAQEH